MTSYTYSDSKDFVSKGQGSIVLHELQTEIKNEIKITPTVKHIDLVDDDITIYFDTSLTTEEQSLLTGIVNNYTILEHITSEIYDAVVDSHGNGDYLLPSAAFAAGHTSIFMRNGTYTESVDVIIPSGGSLVGESASGVVIDFNGAYSVKSDASGGSKQSVGTISCSNNSTAVTGTTTSFTSLSPGDFILIGLKDYEIKSIESDTAMTLSDPYKGNAVVDSWYFSQTMHTGIKISTLTIMNSSTTGLYIRACRHSSFESITLKYNSPNMTIDDSGNSVLKQILSQQSTGIGITLNNAAAISCTVLNVYNSSSHGIEIKGGSIDITIDACESSNNAGIGVCITDTSTDVNVMASAIRNNITSGIHCSSGAIASSLNINTIQDNGTHGIDIDGKHHVVTGNNVKKNGDHGIRVLSIESVISGNISRENTSDGITVTGDDNIINGNISTGNSLGGINITAGATNNIATYNNLTGNTGTNLVDSGTTSDVVGNKQ